MLTFDRVTDFPAVREVFPAEPLIWLFGSATTFKPVSALREHELREDFLPIYPIAYKYQHTEPPAARWWATLHLRQVEILCKKFSKNELLPKPENYSKVTIHGDTAYLPKPLSPEVRLSALTQWRRDGENPATRKQAEALEHEQVEQIKRFLADKIYSKGYVLNNVFGSALFLEYINKSLEQHTGLDVRILFLDSEHLRHQTRMKLTISFDSLNRNESFYDFTVPVNSER